MNAPVAIAALPEGLPAAASIADLVTRARAALDDGDYQAALLLSGKAYNDAKFAGEAGKRVAAAEGLIRKAHALQGDALLIEARAKIRVAEEYDSAQERGEAAKPGRPKNVADGDIFHAAEAGLTRQQIHEARKLRDAETATPGLIERAIAARLDEGLAPNRANLRAAIGTDTATAEERGNNLYETPPEALATLLAVETFPKLIWEPACGRGAISKLLEAAGHDVLLSDLVDYGTTDRHGTVQDVVNFIATGSGYVGHHADVGNWALLTNPPFGEQLNGFVAHALRVHKPKKMALLLNLNFVCGFDDDNRNFAMDECRPSRVHVFSRRLPMMHRDGWTGPEASSRMNTAWFVWERIRGRYGQSTQLLRHDWKDYAEAST